MAEFLFWPALLAYGEAAVAYAGNVRYPGLGRLATWGVRAGWVAQTALLVVQAYRADRFPWDTWAGSLNLFVWLVVGGYLVWGCKPRYRLLGLAVMPLAAALGGLYLWEERALKLRRPGLLRLRAPSLLTLEALGWRTVAVALPLLTLGMVAGFVHRAALDPQIVVTLVAWALYAGFLIAHPRGRRAAHLQLAGFALVLTAPLGLLLTHLS